MTADAEASSKEKKKCLVTTLASRVAALEALRTEGARRALGDLRRSCPLSWRRRWVAADYYEWDMATRAATLGVAVEQMCKTMLLENKQWRGDGDRFYLVVVQYAATFNAMTLRRLLAERSGTSRNSFNFRVADADACLALTGFEHGAVTPFGCVATDVPVVLSKACLNLGVLWMGGGHPQLKLACAVPDFLHRFSPLVLDVSDPR